MDLRKGFHEPAEKPRRFYKTVAVAPVEGGFQVMLDGRNLRTPKARLMVLPNATIAQQVADEWAAQGETIEMASMPATRLANTSIESIPATRDGVADQVAQYAGSDLLCYFADGPEALVARQRTAWEPVLARAEAEAGLRFECCVGIVHRDQPAETLARVRAMAAALDDFSLAGFAFGASLFGSAILALALQRGWIDGGAALDLSRVDEAFQEETWGIDQEAAERVAGLRIEAIMLDRWFEGLNAA